MRGLLIAALLFLFSMAGAQDLLHRNFVYPFNLYLSEQLYADSSAHTSFLPVYRYAAPDSLPSLFAGNRHLLRFTSEKIPFAGISPLITAGFRNGGYEAGGGLKADFTLRHKLAASLTFEAVNVNPSGYEDSLSSLQDGFPDRGYFDSGNTLTDLRGYVAWRPFRFLTVEAGRGKHFIGDGYRSMMLSDFAPSYPYLKLATTFWKIRYTNLFSSLSHNDPDHPPHRNKYTATHLLDYNVTRWLNLGIFETIIFEPRAESGFDVQYLNPVIFYRPVEYSTGSADNALLGAHLKATVAKRAVFYGQLVLDEFLLGSVKADLKHLLRPNDNKINWGWWANKYGYQAGLLLISPVKMPVSYSLRCEFNGARPFTYSHGSVFQSYTHAGYPLAHPLGANFREGLFIADVWKGPFFGRFRASTAVYGADEGNFNFGQDISKSYTTRSKDFHNFTTQGISTTLSFTELSAGVVLHETSGLTFRLGWQGRKLSSIYNAQSESFFFASLRSSLLNSWQDR